MEEFDAEEVRQGETGKGVRWMLLVGTIAAVAVLAVLALVIMG